MTERLKEFLQQKRWLQLKKTDWIAVALVGVLLLVVAMPSGGTGIHLAENKKEDTAQEKTEQKYEKEDYAEYLEHKLEQVEGSIMLDELQLDKTKKYAIVMGNEVKGVQQEVINHSDGCIEIPQYGTKHSLNVSVTTGIVIWDLFKKLR